MFNEGILDHGGLLGLLDDDHTQYVPVDGSRAATKLGVGVVAPANTRAHVEVAATDTIGITIDGYTNDFSGTGSAQGMLLLRDISTGTTTVGMASRGLGFGLYQRRDMQVPDMGTLAWTTFGITGGVYDYGNMSGGIGFGETIAKTIAGIQAYTDQLSIADTSNAAGLLTQYGVYMRSRILTPTINKAGGTLTIDHYGGYAIAQITNPTLTAGTLVVNTYGLYGEAVGHATGTEKAYGVYGKASGADDNYAGYFEGDTMHTADVFMPNLPVVDPAVAGQLWNDGGILKVSAG